MRHMGISGKIAVGALLAALALLVLTGITMHEWVLVCFLGACITAYVACVAEVVVRDRLKTLAASGAGSILFIAFSVAFMRQWGLAFNSDPDALSTRVDADHPDLYFYLAAASGAVTLLLLFSGAFLPGRGRQPPAGQAPRRRPASAPRGASAKSTRPQPPVSRPTPRGAAASTGARRSGTISAGTTSAGTSRSGVRPSATASAKSSVKSSVTAPPGKPPTAKAPARTADRTSPRR